MAFCPGIFQRPPVSSDPNGSDHELLARLSVYANERGWALIRIPHPVGHPLPELPPFFQPIDNLSVGGRRCEVITLTTVSELFAGYPDEQHRPWLITLHGK
jgi:hypothetical protein